MDKLENVFSITFLIIFSCIKAFFLTIIYDAYILVFNNWLSSTTIGARMIFVLYSFFVSDEMKESFCHELLFFFKAKQHSRNVLSNQSFKGPASMVVLMFSHFFREWKEIFFVIKYCVLRSL